MLTTVYFATNRALEGPATDWTSYGTNIVAPTDPTAITYATAFVDNTNLTADTTGAIQTIENVSTGRFSQSAMDDLSNPGRNLLVFIHGFDNSFEAGITRAAFNREWFAQSGVTGADTTVVAFSWPSLGRLLDPPLPWSDYLKDQTMAGQSALHLMSFFANLQPIVDRARQHGNRVFLLAHSMGNYALQGAIQSLRSIAFIIGPFLFAQTFAWFIDPQRSFYLPGAPYYLAAAMLFVAMLLATRLEDTRATKRTVHAGPDDVVPSSGVAVGDVVVDPKENI